MAGGQPNETGALEDNDVAAEKARELWLLLTSWYLIIESFRAREASDAAYRTPQALRKSFHAATPTFSLWHIVDLKPNFLVAMVQVIAHVRWQESSSLPLIRVSPDILTHYD
jgi:hypothetical protein